MTFSKNRYAVIEPLAHMDGHYNHFMKKIYNILTEADLDVTKIVTIKSETSAQEGHNEIATMSNSSHAVFKKFISFVKPSPIKRLLHLDILSVIALHRARKNYEVIVFLSTFYFLPYIYSSVFLKNKRVIFYRFSQPYFNNKLLNRITIQAASRQSCNIYFQTKKIKSEFENIAHCSANYMPIPLQVVDKNSVNYHTPLLVQQKKDDICILLFGINHASKDTSTFLEALRLIRFRNMKVFQRIRLIVAGVQIADRGRITGEQISKEFNRVTVLNKTISEEEKIALYEFCDFAFAGFKKSFNSSSGTINDCLELQTPIITSSHLEISNYLLSHESATLYEAEDIESLYTAMIAEFLKNGRDQAKVKSANIPVDLTVKSFLEKVL